MIYLKLSTVLRRWLRAVLNPSFLLCFGLAWMVTNGWCYLFMLFGNLLDIRWMSWIGAGYAGLLWLPFTPEKLLTLTLAIALLRLLFPNDTRTLALLREELTRLRVKCSGLSLRRLLAHFSLPRP